NRCIVAGAIETEQRKVTEVSGVLDGVVRAIHELGIVGQDAIRRVPNWIQRKKQFVQCVNLASKGNHAPASFQTDVRLAPKDTPALRGGAGVAVKPTLKREHGTQPPPQVFGAP